MDDYTDKVYMWMTVLTFIGFAVAIAFGVMEIMEYRDATHVIDKSVFGG